MKQIHFFLMAIFALLRLSPQAQGIQAFYQSCNPILLNAAFKKDTTKLVRDFDAFSLTSGSYRLNCAQNTLYGLPVEKTVLVVYEDTVRAVSIFMPFDSTLLERMETDLGTSANAWTAMNVENEDTIPKMQNKRWLLRNLVVVLSYTRSEWLVGENVKDDRIIISLSKRRND